MEVRPTSAAEIQFGPAMERHLAMTEGKQLKLFDAIDLHELVFGQSSLYRIERSAQFVALSSRAQGDVIMPGIYTINVVHFQQKHLVVRLHRQVAYCL